MKYFFFCTHKPYFSLLLAAVKDVARYFDISSNLSHHDVIIRYAIGQIMLHDVDNA
jgi:hypothetical protein